MLFSAESPRFEVLSLTLCTGHPILNVQITVLAQVTDFSQSSPSRLDTVGISFSVRPIYPAPSDSLRVDYPYAACSGVWNRSTRLALESIILSIATAQLVRLSPNQ